MGNETNNKTMKKPVQIEDAANRPFCVFYVHQATPKAIHADTVMAFDADEARRLTAEKHKDGMILHVRSVGTDDHGHDLTPQTPADSKDHLPRLASLPGARFINGEFRAADCHDESELDALSD